MTHAQSEKTGRLLNGLGLFTSLFALAINIARNLQGVVDLADFSEVIVRNWEQVTRVVRVAAWSIAHSVLAIDLSWVTIRLIPTLLVLISIVGFGLRRGAAGAIGRRLGIAERAPGATTALAFVLFAAMLMFEQSYFAADLHDRPPGMNDVEAQYAHEYFAACRQRLGLSDTSPLDSLCALESAESPVIKAVAHFGLLDWAVIITYLGLLSYVVLRLQEEVFLAFLLAGLVIGLGYAITALRGSP